MKRLLIILLFTCCSFVLCSCGCEHVWREADCYNPKTCIECGETEGNQLGHSTSWSEWELDHDEAVEYRELICSRCEEIINKETNEVSTFIKNDVFTFSADDFSDRFDNQAKRLNKIDYYSKEEYNENMSFFDENNTIYYRVQDRNNNYKDIGIYMFNRDNGKNVSVYDQYDNEIINNVTILIENSYDVSAFIYATVLTCDPIIGYSEAADVGQEILNSLAINIGNIDEENFNGIDYNGINYLLYKDRDYHYLVVSISNTNK